MSISPPLTVSAWLRWDIVQRWLREHDDISSVIEIGAGMGSVGARLASRYHYLGVEPDRHSARVAQTRVGAAGTVVVGDDSAIPTDAAADLVCAFEVLEHIEDDTAALRSWREHVLPGGALMISVPAWRRRFGPSDVNVGHFRRYDREDLERTIRAGGFSTPAIWSYGFPLGYVLQPVWNLIARSGARESTTAERTAASGRWIQPPDRVAWLPWLASSPFRIIQRRVEQTDLGTGFVAIARRP